MEMENNMSEECKIVYCDEIDLDYEIIVREIK